MKAIVSFALLIVVAVPASAWDDKGHMIIARLAWNQLTEAERGKVLAILKHHPDFRDYLTADRPKDCSQDEWVFLRAATWSDWIRDARKDEHDHWHQISLPYVPSGSKISAKDHEPPGDQENVVSQLPFCLRHAQEGSDADRAKAVAWICHLVGDIHQPLHCASRFDDQYPKGDNNALDAMIRVDGKNESLHVWWDCIGGHDTSLTAIDAYVKDIDAMLKKEPGLVRDDLAAHKSFESWAKESRAVAQEWVYLDGRLKTLPKAQASSKKAPELPDNYAENATRIANIQFIKAGDRLAEQLRIVLAGNK